jgi:hypothetical protein
MAVNHHRPSGGMRPSTKAQGWTRGRLGIHHRGGPSVYPGQTRRLTRGWRGGTLARGSGEAPCRGWLEPFPLRLKLGATTGDARLTGADPPSPRWARLFAFAWRRSTVGSSRGDIAGHA